jgi:hypothetical protein
MKERVPLQIIENRLVLTAVIGCPSLRVNHAIVEFVVDTGSPSSYLSDKEVRRLQIPIKDKQSDEPVNIGGSTYESYKLPKFDMYILKEGKVKDFHTLQISLVALKTTKCSQKKIQIAQTLPSLFGMDFLEEQKVSLHVMPTEKLAYLEFE